MPHGISSYVILDFGEPWVSGSTYGVLVFDQPHYTFKSIDDVRSFTEGFFQGYLSSSPTDALLTVGIGTNNYGPFVNWDYGNTWAGLITSLKNWIVHPPDWDYSNRISVVAAIDNELDYNTAQNSLDWKSGFTYSSPSIYIDFGSCAGCPSVNNPSYLPNNNWTLGQVFQMADEVPLAGPLPEIYSTDGENARQWQYLNLYGYYNFPGLTSALFGTMTQQLACRQKNNCQSGTQWATDNSPGDGWEQLWVDLTKDPRTYQAFLPFSTDISWEP